MPDILQLIIDALIDACMDTLSLVPFLYLTYLAMEWLEQRAASWSERVVRRAGKAGPLVGALVGVIPQCGFSAMGSTLYAARVISLGTLFAVYLSTSDEMLPVFFANEAPPLMIASILGFKVLIGIIAGFAIDLVLRKKVQPSYDANRICELCEREHCGCEHHHPCDCEGQDGDHHAVCNHNHGHHNIFVAALYHTLQVTLYIFIITFVLSFIMDSIGSDIIANFFMQHPESSIFISGLVGLIPNCAASVVISELYLEGIIGSGAMISGLLIGAGIGLLVLLRANRPMKNNVYIIMLLYAIGVGVALLVNALGIVF